VKRGLPSRALGNAEESVVLALAMSGDPTAFGELVRRRQSWLRNLLRRLCRDPSLADDLAQQTLLQAWRTLGTLRAASAFTAWLRRLAVNTWLQHLRGAAAQSTLAAAPEAGADLADLADPAVPAEPGLQLDLDRALARLRFDVRLCVVLAYHEKLSHGEISAYAGLPLGTVKSHIKRGSEQLRSMLDAYASKEPAA
jgi:RNA polymerase sigma-70 factor, ECF subfamily